MPRRSVFWTVTALAVAAAAIQAWLLGWTCDDAFISFRYAQHFVDGHGLVFNLDPNEAPVEGYTNFSWTMWLALGAMLGKDVRNVGSFFHESEGAYYAMTREIFLAEDQRQAILNMASCQYSGIIFPWHTEEEVETRVQAFFDKSLELRRQYAPLHVRVHRKPIQGDQR